MNWSTLAVAALYVFALTRLYDDWGQEGICVPTT